MDKKVSLKNSNHEQARLGVEMFSKKGYHWLNTFSGKAELELNDTPKRSGSSSDSKKKATKSPKTPKKEGIVVDSTGVSVNSVAFF